MLPPTLFFFLNIAEVILVFLYLWFHIYFWIICSSSVKYTIGTLIAVALHLWIALGSVDILMMLILPIHEHSMWFHLFVSSSVSFFSVL